MGETWFETGYGTWGEEEAREKGEDKGLGKWRERGRIEIIFLLV